MVYIVQRTMLSFCIHCPQKLNARITFKNGWTTLPSNIIIKQQHILQIYSCLYIVESCGPTFIADVHKGMFCINWGVEKRHKLSTLYLNKGRVNTLQQINCISFNWGLGIKVVNFFYLAMFVGYLFVS